jgi:hypothetical protein
MADVTWQADWLWSIPLIVGTIIVHVLGLGFINERVSQLVTVTKQRHPTIAFSLVMGMVVLLAMFLHALEATAWAMAYVSLGALPNPHSALLYSLSAMTSYGHAQLYLTPRWQALGALEAVNGNLLFGLTAAFMFAMIQKVWPPGSR